MKTTKIITAITSLSLIIFISFGLTANPSTIRTGDVVKTGVKNQITASKNTLNEIVTPATFENNFDYLRFDVSKFVNENEAADVSLTSLNYLHFNVNSFSAETEITEMPSLMEFDYLRFDVNHFSGNCASEIGELPSNDNIPTV
ncbi:MAG: hypothetical protein WCR72_14530 [Bacteroidota bacterium]